MRNSTLSPKELAQAAGVSESSVKRWVDSGVIQAVRTAGGHRRISLAEAVRYVRESGISLARPEFLGLPELGPVTGGSDLEDRFHDCLREGLVTEARSLILGQFMAGTSVAALCDGPLRSALERIGETWLHREDGVFFEHRATDLCLQLVRELRGLLEVPASAPSAIGGAVAGDVYSLPTLCASSVLIENGFRAQNLGPNTPLSALRAAVDSLSPSLVWVSVSRIESELEPPSEWQAFVQELESRSASLVVGGRARSELPLPPSRAIFIGANFAELAAFLRGRQPL